MFGDIRCIMVGINSLIGSKPASGLMTYASYHLPCAVRRLASCCRRAHNGGRSPIDDHDVDHQLIMASPSPIMTRLQWPLFFGTIQPTLRPGFRQMSTTIWRNIEDRTTAGFYRLLQVQLWAGLIRADKRIIQALIQSSFVCQLITPRFATKEPDL